MSGHNRHSFGACLFCFNFVFVCGVMGKKQHQKDKLYLTCSEWKHLYGGKKESSNTGKNAEFRRLPFDHCALSFQPFERPVCNSQGVIYDLVNIVPFLKKYGIDPATGNKLEFRSLLKLNFTKDSEGKYHCPVLYKVFNENTHIVAIQTTGNVFSYEAIEQLNIKAKNFTDLLTGESFERKDIITIQDPANLDKFNLSTFHHLQKNLKVTDDEKEGKGRLKSVNSVTRDVLEELKKEEEKKKTEVKNEGTEPAKADKFNAAHYSTGLVAASSTSTAVGLSTQHEAAILEDDIVRYTRVKKKGYIRIETNFGSLNLELHCDTVPKASENFMKLSQKGYYDGTIFHRSIRNFMIQGGDPEGTGHGGESYWGKPFKDEFRPNLSHQGRGILSMANSGPNTNKSQFFITYRSCQHLDKKHSIFGRVVGGLDIMNVMEKIAVDEEDRPKEEIKILKITVFVDPFQEVDDQLAKEREEALKVAKVSDVKPKANEKLKAYHGGVGKYINMASKINDIPVESPAIKKRKVTASQFGDFSTW